MIMYLNLEEVKNYLEKNKKFRIVFVGDSITSTEWIHPNWREIVEYVIKEELTKIISDWKIPSWEIRGINCGFDGSTTEDILNKAGEILDYTPDLIIGLMGGNDEALNISVEESISNIKNILNKLGEKVPYIFWCNSIPALTGYIKNEKYKPYAEETIKIENNGKIGLFDMFNEYQKYDLSKFFTFVSEENLVENIKEGETDPQHPNVLGNAYIAKILLKEIFGIEFNPEKYLGTLLNGEKYPGY